MTDEQFWSIIDRYCKKNNMSMRWLSQSFGFKPNYLTNVRSRNGCNIPSQEKLIKMAKIFTTDEIFEVLVSLEKLTNETDDFLLSLDLSKDIRIINRIKRKIQRKSFDEIEVGE